MTEEVGRGFLLCRNHHLTRSKTFYGTKDSLSIPLNSCPVGSKPIGTYHTHPGGSPQPSLVDIADAIRTGLSLVCVEAKGEIRCYKVPDLGDD